MNSMKSAKKQLLRFVFLIPLFAISLLAFRNSRSVKGMTTKKIPLVQEFATDLYLKNDQPSGQPAYIDEVSVENGMMAWRVNKYIPHEVVLFLDGKPLGKRLLSEYEIFGTEILTKGPLLQKYGLSKNQWLENYITIKNKDNGEVHLFPLNEPLSAAAEAFGSAESLMLNALYMDRETPLMILVEGLHRDKLEMTVKIIEGGGTIQYRHGVYYIKPSLIGNIEIGVYTKDLSGHNELISSRYFRVKDPAEG